MGEAKAGLRHARKEKRKVRREKRSRKGSEQEEKNIYCAVKLQTLIFEQIIFSPTTQLFLSSEPLTHSRYCLKLLRKADKQVQTREKRRREERERRGKCDSAKKDEMEEKEQEGKKEEDMVDEEEEETRRKWRRRKVDSGEKGERRNEGLRIRREEGRKHGG